MKLPAIAFAALAAAGMLVYSTPAVAQTQSDLGRALDKLDVAISRIESAEKSLSNYRLEINSTTRQLQDEVEGLKSRVRLLEDKVRDLYLKAPATGGTSSSYRIETDAIAPRLGRVKLTNQYPEEVSIIVNGISHRLLPGESKTVRVSPGTLTYRVLPFQRIVVERTIAPDEEKSITIFNATP